ncbi:MAG TPA: hypothetical protein VED66_11320 [Candidatus Sulfotelmatobacter sp.]|nr:hypothetical protein [Candidatus Sulfotelmatobacter sp.]
MPKTKLLLATVIVLSLLAALSVGYWRWASRDSTAERGDLLSLMPADASGVGFLDLAQLRNSPFLAQLMTWAPQPTPDSDYAQFVQATGFDYERDLDRLALAFNRQSPNSTVFAVADGRFDRKKIEGYAARFGSLRTAEGRTLFAVPIAGSERKAYFTFLRNDRIAWGNDSSYFFQRPLSASPEEWREHFSRVAGTPIFAVLRQDSAVASALAQAPGGFRSPQLATLLGQLQWISISGKPEGNLLRVVVDGECMTETTVRQLKELLSGIVVLAQIGLNDPKTRKQLDPGLRQGYLDLLQSADIQELDRGTSKSVRVVFDVTPKVLQAPRNAPAGADPPWPAR